MSLQLFTTFEWHLSNQMVNHYSHGGGSTHQNSGQVHTRIQYSHVNLKHFSGHH
jgi:hypothetical protein